MSVTRVSNLHRVQEVFEASRLNAAYIGVPASKGTRTDGPINNATLAYIHEHGAPAANIPARPFLKLGIKRIQKTLANTITNGVVSGLKGGGASSVIKALEQSGAVAAGSAQKVISTSDGLAPLEQSTIARRKAKRGGKDGPNRPLLDTSQLRQSITYVVRKVT